MENNREEVAALIQLKFQHKIPIEMQVEISNLKSTMVRLLDELAIVETRLSVIRNNFASEMDVGDLLKNATIIHKEASFF